MKSLSAPIRLIAIGIIASLVFSSCSGVGTSSNAHLDSLPGMASKYQTELDDLKQKAKESTDMEKAFELDKKYKSLKEEAQQAIDDYLTKNPMEDVPFEQKADYPFTINKVWVENASVSRLSYQAKVTITRDVVNDYGNPTDFFAFAIAVDKDGNSLTSKPATFVNKGRKPFTANMEVEMYGSIDGPADLEKFDKLVFITQEESETYKK